MAPVALFFECGDPDVRVDAIETAAHSVASGRARRAAHRHRLRPRRRRVRRRWPWPTCCGPRAAAATCRSRCSSARGRRSTGWSAPSTPAPATSIEAFWPGGLTLVVRARAVADLGPRRRARHGRGAHAAAPGGHRAARADRADGGVEREPARPAAGADRGRGPGPARRGRRGLPRGRPGPRRGRLDDRRRHRAPGRASCASGALERRRRCARSSPTSSDGAADVTHPSLEYLLVACVAAAVSFLLTPVARRSRSASGAVARPRDRDVHAVATPRMGGVALFARLRPRPVRRRPAADAAASRSRSGPELAWVVVAGGDHLRARRARRQYELDSLTKLAGQVLADRPHGHARRRADRRDLPAVGRQRHRSSSAPTSRIPVTILFTAADHQRDELHRRPGRAGRRRHRHRGGRVLRLLLPPGPGRLHRHRVAGRPCWPRRWPAPASGFLPHNFFPARIFMGDSGSMVLGLMLSAAATTATTTDRPAGVPAGARARCRCCCRCSSRWPVLALPFVDLLLAVLRRVRRGRSPFAPDKQHLHHRLLEIGPHPPPRRAAAVLLVRAHRLRRGRAVLRGQQSGSSCHACWSCMAAVGRARSRSCRGYARRTRDAASAEARPSLTGTEAP